MPWGAKKKSTEKKLPEVSANLCCAISLTYSCVQKLESPSTIVPTTTPAAAKSLKEPKPDEVRWSVRPAIFLTSILIQNFPKNSQSDVPTKTDYTITTVKEVLILAQSASLVVPVPFLTEAIGIALKIMQLCEVR